MLILINEGFFCGMMKIHVLPKTGAVMLQQNAKNNTRIAKESKIVEQLLVSQQLFLRGE